MKLLLTSGGLMNNSIIAALKDLTQKPFNQLNLAFVPTASNMVEGDKSWFIKDLEICKKLGLKTIDLVDISALPKEIWQKRLEATDILFVEGGNTFHLRYWLDKSGLTELLPELLKTKVYIGVSAGSIVMGKSLLLSDSEKEILKSIGEDIIENGLGMVNFLVVPHINSKDTPELTFENIEKSAKKTTFPVYALDDDSAIKVVDTTVEVISEGKWKRFQ